MRIARPLCFLGMLLGGFVVGVEGGEGDYRTGVERWRKEREAELKADDGWFTLAGLHWLDAGETSLGGDTGNGIHLPRSAPSRVGVLTVAGDRVLLQLEPGVAVTQGGKPWKSGEVHTDSSGSPDVLAVGDLRLIVIKRGERFALRVKDNRSPARAAFQGLRWYPVDESWRIQGRFEPLAKASSLSVDTVVGTQEKLESPGTVIFEREGREYRLQAAREGDKLWILFRDATAGRTTSPNARQLLADPPAADGSLWLDFNRAFNLPCAYTPFATCPLAPRQNHLPFPIAAGEKVYEHPEGKIKGETHGS